MVYKGDKDAGLLKTVEIASDGQIVDTVIDTLEFDTLGIDTEVSKEPHIIHISGDVYAIVYKGKDDDGFLKTVEIAANGQIADIVIDTLEFDTDKGKEPRIIHISGDVYAVSYKGTDDDGFLKTIEIASDGQITDTVIDTLEFDILKGSFPKMLNISGDVYAIAYAGDGDDGFLKTVEIAANGQITDTVIDTLEYDTDKGKTPSVIHISGDVYAIAYAGTDDDGFLKTVGIAADGQITDTVIDALEFDTDKGKTPYVIHISGDVYAIAYAGTDDDGFLKTVGIAANGQITDTVIDTLEFDILKGVIPHIIYIAHVPGDVYAKAAIKTNGTVYTGSEETVGTSFTTNSYQWTTNPDTGSAWTWDEIDALQAGVELKSGGAIDTAACTQVYVEVAYNGAYNSSGELTSVNLLSGETLISVDSFDYNASAIPTGTTLKVQFSQDNANWYDSAGTADGWDTLSQGTGSIDLSGLSWSGADFYYKAEFTSDGNVTPLLDEISVIYSGYYESGDLTSSTFYSGDLSSLGWGAISFTIVEPASTDIKFQIRTADAEGGLSSATWYGPTGTDDYYTSTGTDINSVHDDERWVQYKAYFTGPGDDTPTLSDVSIAYSGEGIVYTLSVTGGGYALTSDDSDEWAEGWSITPEFYCEVTQR